MRCASSSVSATGFSMRTADPRSRQWTAMRACVALGVAITTPRGLTLSSIWSKSGNHGTCTASATARPCSDGSAMPTRSTSGCFKARSMWVRPINPAPMTAMRVMPGSRNARVIRQDIKQPCRRHHATAHSQFANREFWRRSRVINDAAATRHVMDVSSAYLPLVRCSVRNSTQILSLAASANRVAVAAQTSATWL